MRNLRVQLLLSHLVLVLMMLIVMIGGTINVFHLGRSIDRILKDNYQSVVAAQKMKDALERQDSAATFVLVGQVQKARRQYEENTARFMKAYRTEANNITESGEQQISDDIGARFSAYQAAMKRLLYANPIVPEATGRDYYFRTLEPAFAGLKLRAQDVLDINQAAILRADVRAKREARTASLMGITVTVGAVGLALFFALRVVAMSLAPLGSLARQAEEIGAGHLNQRIDVQRSDEIGALAAAFNDMAAKLREARREEEARLHRAERMSDAALGSLYDPVIVTDALGRVVQMNRAAEGLFGPESHALGAPISQVTKDDRIADAISRAIHQEHVSAAEDEAGLATFQEGDAQRTYRLRVTPMRDEDGSMLGAAAVLEDVTHLRELDRLKGEFIGVASHELRTPVTSLLLSVQLLEEGAVGELTPEQREVVAAQKEDLERLERMMRDLLDITRLEAGSRPPRLQVVTAVDLVDAAVQAVEGQAEARDIRLEAAAPASLPEFRADPGQINRVLVNLLNNAIRHTPEGGLVTVSAGLGGDSIAFSVSDTGVGIPKEYLPRIFERFVQVPGATRGGAGLGLSIAQTIVRAHGGDITTESEAGKGSTFTFTIPLGDASNPQRPARITASRARKEPTHGTHPDHRR